MHAVPTQCTRSAHVVQQLGQSMFQMLFVCFSPPIGQRVPGVGPSQGTGAQPASAVFSLNSSKIDSSNTSFFDHLGCVSCDHLGWHSMICYGHWIVNCAVQPPLGTLGTVVSPTSRCHAKGMEFFRQVFVKKFHPCL